MTRCPNCGSSAQVRVTDTEYIENGWEIEVIHTYKCGCGCVFIGTACYQCQECYEIVEKLPIKCLTK